MSDEMDDQVPMEDAEPQDAEDTVEPTLDEQEPVPEAASAPPQAVQDEVVDTMVPSPDTEPAPVAAPQAAAPPAQYTPPQQPPGPYYPAKPPKDRSIAIILELLPGLFGILGIGWIYAGNTGAGIAWMIGMFVWVAIAAIFAVFTVGISLFCTLPVNLVLVIISTISLNNYTKKQTDIFGPP